MVAPLLALAIPASATIAVALLGFLGLIMKNDWMLLLSAIGFLYLIFPILPTGLKIMLAFVLFLWILKMGKGK